MPEHSRVVTIGSALVDIFVESNAFSLQPSGEGTLLCQEYGEKIDIDRFTMVGGGGGGNAAVGYARLGFATSIVAELGKDTLAQFVRDELEAASVRTDWLVQEKSEETGLSVILVAPEGGRTVFVHRGASTMLDEHDLPWAQLAAQDAWPHVVHLASIGGRLAVLRRLFAYHRDVLSAHHKQILAWNPGKAEIELLKSGVLPIAEARPEILLVNTSEWQRFGELKDWFLQHPSTIVVTGGSAGVVVIEKEQLAQHYPVMGTSRVVDETGAGDAFGVGFISGKALGLSTELCVERGMKNARSVVGQVGAKAGLLSKLEP